jgi:hypothetical protein
MSIKNIVLTGFIALLTSCNNEGKTSSEIISDSPETAINKKVNNYLLSSGCYLQAVGRDTSFLQIENRDSSVNGSLSYIFFQKDRNDGKFQGELSGDILIGWYLFKSEGVMSVREVAWKINGNQLWPGIGEMEEKNDTMKFVNSDIINFDSTQAFKKVECVL